MKKLLLAIPAVVLFVPACGQAVGVDMPAESYTPLPTAGSSTPPPIVLPVEPVDPPVETAEPQGDEFVVTYVIDGDTIEVNTGERVRLIGIDTLEEGECGFEEASQRMEKLTLGETVTLTPGAQDDVDRYGRLLRYVDVGEVDAGEVMLREGFAIPRYNSTDGYGHHPREELYFGVSDLDGFAELLVSCGATWPEPNDVPAPDAPVHSHGEEIAPQGGPDMDCSDFSGPVDTSGGDPHGLDRDGDGIGCEAN
jgi:endonuclease YncB( thermonuclease family)